VMTLAPMAAVTIATPAMSSARCANGDWWDPKTNVCRPLAAVFHWPDDREESDRITIGYTTIALNLNVLLQFFWGVVSARRSGLSRPWTVLVGLANAVLGLLVITVNLALKK
jgi:hypothetical protein